MLKGWRTIAVNASLAGAEAALIYLNGVGWVEQVGPTWSVMVVALINMGLRTVTDTPLGKSS